MPRKSSQKTSNVLLKAATTAVVIGSAIYTAYSLWKDGSKETQAVSNEAHIEDLTGGETVDRRKNQAKGTSITLVVSPDTVRVLDKYNDSHEDGLDLQEYLRYYPSLTVILYPGVSLTDLGRYFEIDPTLEHRIIPTTKEESVFHVAKQLSSAVNLFNFADFDGGYQHAIETYHVDRFLRNLTDTNGRIFTEFI